MGLLLPGIIAGQTEEKSEPAGSEKPEGIIFTIRVRHLAYEDAYEDHMVRLGESFFIADTEYAAKVERFVPDFAMDKKTKEVVSRSNEWNNPALLIRVSLDEAFAYETWILYQNMTPHAVHDPGYYYQFIAYEKAEDAGTKTEGPSGDKK